MTHKYQGAVKPQSHSKSARHYRLTNKEWLKAVKELRPRERDVLYYLRTIQPWGDKDLAIGVREIATALECSPGTVSKALKVLDQKGWIDLEIIAAKVRLRTDKSDSAPVEMSDSQDVLPTGNTVFPGKHLFPTDNDRFLQTTGVSPKKHLTPETQPEQGSQIALNSLKLHKHTTHLEPECGGVSVYTNKEARSDIKVSDRSMANSEKSETVCEPKPTEKDLDSAAAILQPAKKLGVNVNDRQLLRVVEQWPNRVDAAIAALEEKANHIKSPTRFLVRAIQDGWQPEAPRKAKTPGFGQWYREGRARFLVCASRRVDGMLKVLMACDEWVPYDLLQTLSWDDIAVRFGAPQQECHAS